MCDCGIETYADAWDGGARQHYVEYDFKENVLAPLDEVKRWLMGRLFLKK